MGMGTFANYADVISSEFLEEQCPEQYNKLISYIDKIGITIDDLAMYLDEYTGLDEWENIDEGQEDEIRSLYSLLQEEFNKKVELNLFIRYHSAEDRYDEVNGAFWSIEGVYEMTPEAKKIKSKIERMFWTTFG